MNNNQRKYIEYIKDYSQTIRTHIWLGGSFLHGNPTPFSDIDISVFMGIDDLKAFIYGYGDPIYMSYTSNPEGIIIVIYEDGVAVDLEVIESVDVTDNSCFLHMENIKDRVFNRNSSISKEICHRNDLPYQIARLLHRSLIKYLAGKKETGVSIANEIVAFLNSDCYVTGTDYKSGISHLIDQYHDKYPLDTEYRNLCLELIKLIETNATLDPLILNL